MIRIEADTLAQAFSKASEELSCSVTEIDVNVIQHPSGGILGFFKKTAIIEAKRTVENKASGEERPKKSRNRRSRNRKR